MNGFSKLAVAMGVAGLALTAPALADMKIGVVNSARLIQESPQGKSVQALLQTEFAARQKELQGLQIALKAKEDKLKKDGDTMSADERSRLEKDLKDGSRDYSQKLQNYQDDANTRQNEELSKVQSVLVEEVQNYAREQKFDLILTEAVYANPSLDVTSGVLAALQARAAKAGTAPAAPAAPAKAPATK
ncbi:MAG TPA: OmpH family outer membrane protein [Steroidobacteraceae bacterium]|nr:OmpH family outer membrane protein [Steroidobacteraceae bacterium]